jgi:hypothetical protein
MQHSIKRYSLEKEFIETGVLTITTEAQTTYLDYVDSKIKESTRALYHPIKALEDLRKILEVNHASLLGCIGCRIDSAYRATGHFGTYIVKAGGQAIERAELFDPTNEVQKLCTVEEHKIAYKKWADSLK